MSLSGFITADNFQTHNSVVFVGVKAENLTSLREQIEAIGYRLVMVTEGAPALAVIDREMPHLVMIDIDLPDMPGTKLLRLIRTESRARSTVVSIVSDRMKVSFIPFQYCSDGIYQYPFDPAELVRNLKRVGDPYREGPDGARFSTGYWPEKWSKDTDY